MLGSSMTAANHLNEYAGGVEGQAGAFVGAPSAVDAVSARKDGLREIAAVLSVLLAIAQPSAGLVLLQLCNQRAQQAVHLWTAVLESDCLCVDMLCVGAKAIPLDN